MNQKDIQQNISGNYPSIGQKLSHEAVFMSVAKKAEKISTALYMVTDLIDSTDPIRQKLRLCSVELIGQTRRLSSAFSGDIYFDIARTINTSWELVSLIEVSSSVGFISDMNAKILKTVLIEFISSLRDKQKRESFSHMQDLKIGESLSDQITLSKKLFEIDEEESYKGQTIKDKEMSFIKPQIYKQEKAEKIKREFKSPQIEQASSRPNTSENKPKSSERKDKIIEIVREKNEVNIGDIATSFPDVSSKTIQRELTSLVEENVLLKTGEKRWSKYSLSQDAL